MELSMLTLLIQSATPWHIVDALVFYQERDQECVLTRTQDATFLRSSMSPTPCIQRRRMRNEPNLALITSVGVLLPPRCRIFNRINADTTTYGLTADPSRNWLHLVTRKKRDVQEENGYIWYIFNMNCSAFASVLYRTYTEACGVA